MILHCYLAPFCIKVFQVLIRRTPQHHLKVEAESVMQILVACVQYTAVSNFLFAI
jgi:hypothetical protein